MTKDTNRNNLKHETKEWKKYRSYLLVTNAGSNLRPSDFTIRSSHIYNYRLLVNDIQWIHKGSSCILLRSSMSIVSCLRIHRDRKEISSSFVTKKQSFLTEDPKKPYPSDQVKRQIKYQCWLVDKHTRPWGSLFIFPWGIYEAVAFLIPVSSASLVCTNCYTIIYGLAYCIQTQQRILELKETEN